MQKAVLNIGNSSLMTDYSHGSESALSSKGIQRNRFFQNKGNLPV
jgi:hypothetical protein